jgi:hypothetical protein
MNKHNLYMTVFLAILKFSNSFSQAGEYVTIRDLETWGGVGVNYEAGEKWKFTLEEQIRLKENSGEVDEFFTELNVNFELTDNIFLGAGLRYVRENDNEGKIQGYENHLRYNFDAGFKHKINRFSLKYRLRFQSKNELGISSEEGDYANKHLRLKVGTGYNISNWKLDPVFSAEIFRHYEKEAINGFDKFRITLGTKYKIKKIGEFKFFYRIEKELNTTYPKTTNILGLNYSYTFKNK